MLLLGLDGAGKTSVMNQAIAATVPGSTYVVPPPATNGFGVFKLNSGSYTLNIWESKQLISYPIPFIFKSV